MSNKGVFACALVAALSLPVQRGVAQDLPPFHRGPWPIHNGFNHQPTQNELRALHHEDVTPDEAREVDRLYDQLLPGSEKVLRQHIPQHGTPRAKQFAANPHVRVEESRGQ
jgi:hypothetical protein